MDSSRVKREIDKPVRVILPDHVLVEPKSVFLSKDTWENKTLIVVYQEIREMIIS